MNISFAKHWNSMEIHIKISSFLSSKRRKKGEKKCFSQNAQCLQGSHELTAISHMVLRR